LVVFSPKPLGWSIRTALNECFTSVRRLPRLGKISTNPPYNTRAMRQFFVLSLFLAAGIIGRVAASVVSRVA